ncbi:DUF3105 domain-containing protein [Nocardioides sp.]|uniref:DUF3105 domain-containing protein n=1 Tax=Nocardioides sp. TaxID=35761 RepID=UPI002624F23B|nr:DUF3105 domain-containing protein [Nocardioides sp.]MDI6908564.1 DUF3105 domain-containing protein [Nocardioides sp.]
MSDLPPPPAYPPPPPAYPPPPPLPPEPSQGRRSLPVVLAVAGAVLVLVVAVAVPLVVRVLRADRAAQEAAGLAAVREYDGLSRAHTAADVDYPQTPPVGGPHAGAWLDCGVYDEPVRDENAVHDLEHGTVWITYDPDLDAADVATLADLLPANGILSPYAGLPAPVVVTVWGRQLELDGADDARLALFVRTFGGGETAPEPFASCAGGVTDPDGVPGTNV